jgi:hypothetical protein
MLMSRSSTVWLFVVGTVATLATACGSDHDSVFQLGYNLIYVPPANDPGRRDLVTCRSADTPKLELQSVNTGNNATIVDRFTCEPNETGGVVESSVLPQGNYEEAIRLLDSSGTSVSENSTPGILRRGGPTDLGNADLLIQSFHVTWSILRGGQPVQCSAVGATKVTLTAMLGDKMAMSKDFPCGDRVLDSPAILTGPYTIQMTLANDANQALSPPQTTTIDVNDNARAVLPTITFSL